MVVVALEVDLAGVDLEEAPEEDSAEEALEEALVVLVADSAEVAPEVDLEGLVEVPGVDLVVAAEEGD